MMKLCFRRLLVLFFTCLFVLPLVRTRLARAAELSKCEKQCNRPNIIFLLTDDQRENTFGATGHPFVKTPNIDRLLARSVRFSNTYTAAPVCAPSRVSYLTGMCERVHGIGFTSSFQLTEAQWERSYPALLRESGYHTGFIGKFGVEYYTFRGRAADKFDYWWGHDGWTSFFPKDSQGPSCLPYHRAQQDTITAIMGEAMTEFLDQLPTDKRFCLSVSFNVPHGSQTTSMYTGYPNWHLMERAANENPALAGSRFYGGLYRDVDIQIPQATATDPYKYIPRFIMDQDTHHGRSKTYEYDYTRPTCLEHHVRYYQTLSGLDDVIGNLLEELRRRDLAQNTVIIFSSDHGLLMGEYGMGGKALLYDLSSRVPCFIYDPRLPTKSQGREVDRLVSTLDIPQTILDYADVAAPEFMDGKSLRPWMEGKEPSWREELFLESLYTGRDTPFQEGICTGKWKYVRMFDGKEPYTEADVDFSRREPDFEMLFDLDEDPDEANNLVNSHAESQILAKLRNDTASHSGTLIERRREFQAAVKTQYR